MMDLAAILSRDEHWRLKGSRRETNASQAAHDRAQLVDYTLNLQRRIDSMRAEIARLEMKAAGLEQALRGGGRR